MARVNLKLKSPQEIKELIETSGITDLGKMKDIVNYIDKLQKQLLDYQSFMDTIVYMAENRNVNASL